MGVRRVGVTRPGRISGDGDACADIPRDHAAGSDHRAVTNGHAGQDNGAAPDPDIAADPHRTPEFDAAAPGLGIAGMIGGVDLRGGSDLRSIADGHFDDIQDDAIEVQENLIAETDVVAEVAEKRWPDHGAGADMPETNGSGGDPNVLTSTEYPHYQNFVDALRAGDPKILTCEILEGHLSSTLPHLANIAYLTKQSLEFDGTTETFKNNKAADKLLTREYRRGFEVPEKT